MERYAMFVHYKIVSKISILPNWPINSIKSHITIIEGFGIKTDKMIQSYMWKYNDSKFSHNNHEIYNKCGELTLPDLMTH